MIAVASYVASLLSNTQTKHKYYTRAFSLDIENIDWIMAPPVELLLGLAFQHRHLRH